MPNIGSKILFSIGLFLQSAINIVVSFIHLCGRLKMNGSLVFLLLFKRFLSSQTWIAENSVHFSFLIQIQNQLKPNLFKTFRFSLIPFFKIQFSYECFNSVCNISFQRSWISLDLLFRHWVSNIRNNTIMYVLLN